MGAFPVGRWFKPLIGGAMERDHKQEPRVPGEPVAGMRIEMPPSMLFVPCLGA